MSLRDRLLAHLRRPAYAPANEFELSRQLSLGKKERRSLAHEVRLLLKTGDFVRVGNGRIAPRRAENRGAPKRPAEARPVFTPTKLEGTPVKVTGVIRYNFVTQ